MEDDEDDIKHQLMNLAQAKANVLEALRSNLISYGQALHKLAELNAQQDGLINQKECDK